MSSREVDQGLEKFPMKSSSPLTKVIEEATEKSPMISPSPPTLAVEEPNVKSSSPPIQVVEETTKKAHLIGVQGWIYEALHLLGKLFANRKEKKSTPHCLHWEAKEPEYKEITRALMLANGTIDLHNILHASNFEKCQPYFKQFEFLNDKCDDLIEHFVKKLKECNSVLSGYKKEEVELEREEHKIDVSDDPHEKEGRLQLQMLIQIRIQAM
ncbi:uncharacterized protein LOC133816631 [Humulus lupulus]|uniref:uncharacterized protein LOC133816631 n=1 Tax=Humulus lupulus TaxID=3486 RepID=UPI002B4068BE|nr:uncharacterized protein LOC133816631 [Humulus lupulus]